MEGGHRARLLADGGASATTAEFFRSAEFMEAEGVTHTLEIELGDGALKMPLIVEEAGEGWDDGVSPYGYPGAGGDGSARIDPANIDFSETNLVAIFVRHRLDEVPFQGTTDNNVVYISDPSVERYSRPQDRHQVQRNLAEGFDTEMIHGPDCSDADRAEFARVYAETMKRREAKGKYFFSDEYFARVLNSEHSHLAVTQNKDGVVVAASIVVFSDGYMHYFLTGSDAERHEESPTKNLVTFLVEKSYKLGIPLNFGGGLKDDRGKLAMFKRGFSNREVIWQTSEIICNADAYRELSAGCADTEFFPAYREPKSGSFTKQ